MDRERLMEIIDSNGRFNLPTVELELLADELIANGIGDITTEKHRANVAEEALKISCENCVECPYILEDNNKYCKAGYGDVTEECDTSKAYLCWAEYYTQQAAERLKEKQ